MPAIPEAFFLPSTRFTPAYLQLGLTDLRRRAEEALDLLRSCVVCPRDCRVDRLADKWALCKTGRYAIVGSFFAHFGEEDCLRGWNGSGTIFFSMCNLRCVFCFRPGARVLTDLGMQRIEEIFEAAGDEVVVPGGRVRFPRGVRVVTATGRLATVTKAFQHPYEGTLVVIKPVGLPAIACTPNHELFARLDGQPTMNRVRADELTPRHRLLVPLPALDPPPAIDAQAVLQPFVGTYRRPARRRAPLLVLQAEAALASAGLASSREVADRLGYHPTYARALLARVRRGLRPQEGSHRNELVREGDRIRFTTERGAGVPSTLPVTPELARLLGYYCAEGHVARVAGRPNSYRLVLSFGRHETSLVEEVRGLFRAVFGVEARVYPRQTTVTVEVGSASLALLMVGLCGKGSHGKHVPAVLFRSPEHIVRAFLEAYWAGDGTRQGAYITATTVSEELAYGLAGLLLRIGIHPYFYATPRPPWQVIGQRVVRQSTTLFLVKCRRDVWEGHGPSAGRRPAPACVPIRSITRVPYTGPVYNLEVADESHSYLVNGVAVANCQNYDISQLGEGRVVTPRQLAAMMLHLQDQGCHNLNFVTPEHVVPQILEALPLAVEHGLRLPIVYNTSSYDSMHSLRLLDGIVDIYMPDFKYWTPERARHYLKAPDYPEVARRVITEMHRQVGPLRLDEHGLAKRGLIVRHLVMPGALDDTRAILRWIATTLGPETYVNVMDQYYPAGQVGKNPKYEDINRRLFPAEFAEALRAAREAGLVRLDVRIPRRPWVRWEPVPAAAAV
ncbi:MAG: LAGLIDADG family homing endonuclease [Armatimonadota bacterium]|nr:LAGLIDADG family homing endonuclease [Armatimonadota bacterium]MDR7584969.1 LAGLIDADG family homing endonuclease [Armatimonadota bacterium]